MQQAATLIKATTFNRVSSKAGVFLGYTVKSDTVDRYYHLTFDGAHWHCDCPATVKCKHIKALNEHLKARREAKEAAAAAQEAAKAVAEAQRIVTSEHRSTAQYGTRSGIQGFSLLR